MLLAKLVKQLSRMRLQPHIGRLHAAVLKRAGGRIRRSWRWRAASRPWR